MSKRLIVVVVAVLCAAVASVAIAGKGDTRRDAFDRSAKLRKAVSADAVLRHLDSFQAIADANGGTRASGQPGYDRSANYVARKMTKAGYRVERQSFEFEAFTEESPTEFAQVAPTATTYEAGVDFDIAEFSGSGDVTAELVAIDLVIPPGAEPSTSDSGCEADDFTGTGVAGKIALVQRGTCDFAVKADNAATAGAVGVVIFNEGQPGRDGLLSPTLSAPRRLVPVIGTTFALGEKFANGETSGLTGVTVRLATDTSSEIVTTENVIATGRRGDASNVVMSGAHLDSVAEGPGINDNGSGSAGLLEIATDLARQKDKPKNRLRFAWWGAEESGLVGSTEYVADLTEMEGSRIALYLNFDMIGSPNFARFVYDGNGSAFGLSGPEGSDTIECVFQRYFERKGLASGQTAFDGRSDYLPFIEVGIPSGGLFTGAEAVKTPAQQAAYGGTDGEAFDPCYHAACDDGENVSRRALEQMSDAAAHTIHKFSNDLKFVREKTVNQRRTARGREAISRARAGDRYTR